MTDISEILPKYNVNNIVMHRESGRIFKIMQVVWFPNYIIYACVQLSSIFNLEFYKEEQIIKLSELQ